jgi:hypothetical protein
MMKGFALLLLSLLLCIYHLDAFLQPPIILAAEISLLSSRSKLIPKANLAMKM